MPASQPKSAAPESLAKLLGCPEERREYASILESANDALQILTRDLGAEWVSRLFPSDIVKELQSNEINSSARHSPRRDKNLLYGTGLPSEYVALSLRLGDNAKPGLRLLQASILAGLFIRRRNNKKPAQSHLNTVATFLIGASDTSDPRVRAQRERYLSKLGTALDAAKILSETQNSAAEFPVGFLVALTEILGAINLSRQISTTSNPKPPDHPLPGIVRGPHLPSPAPISTLVSDPEADLEVISGELFPLTPKEINDAVEQAESAAELLPSALGAQSECSTDLGFHIRIALAKSAFLDVRQGLWCRNQWDALSQAEMKCSIETWFAKAEAAFAKANLIEIESALLVLLTGCTGWNHEQLWSTPFIRNLQTLPTGHERAILLAKGEISFLAPRKGSRYDPIKRGHVSYVQPVSDRVILKLPSKLSDLLNLYLESRESFTAVWLQSDLPLLLESIRSYQENARLMEPRETLARIRNAHLVELVNAGQDLPLAQLASGEFLGVNDVGLAYASFPAKRVQELYSKVCLTHGYGQIEANAENDLVGGSSLQVSKETALSISSHNRAGLGQPFGYAKASKSEKLQLQNTLAPATAWQICAMVSMRPGDYAGAVTIRNFSMEAKCAVFAEKILDEGHIGRLVPLCPTLMKTLTAYGHHLVALSIDKEIPSYFKKAASLALSGEGPLFFTVGNGKTRSITSKDLSRRLPRSWKLPLNTFRHRLASKLRELDCPGVYVEALLGHIELGIQPFGSESFMDPLAYLENTSQAIEQLIVEDGWKVLHGLPASDNPPWEPRPLGPWVLKLLPNHLAHIESIRKKNQDALDNYQASQLEEIKVRVVNALQSRIPDFSTSKGGELNKGDLRDLRSELTRDTGSLAEVETIISVLREHLIDARDERGWKIPRLPYFHRGPVEASPFGTEFPAALDSFLHLRNYFTDVLNEKRKAPRAFTQRSKLVMALILWHGVSDWDRLSNILKNLHRGRNIEGLADAIAVPFEVCDDPICESAELLRGAVALAAADFAEAGHPIVATKKQIGSEIARSLPSWISEESGESLLNVLLEAAKITHFFEHAPPLRDVWTGQTSSVGLTLVRFERLFSDGPIVLSNPASTPTTHTSEETVSSNATPMLDASTKKSYAELRNVLRIPKARPKILTYAKTELSLGTPDATLQTELTKEIDTYLIRHGDGGGICQLLAQYSKRLLNPMGRSDNVVRPRTVYNYIVPVGGSLSRISPYARLLTMEAEQLFETYKLAVDSSKPFYRPFVATYLSYFHAYLVREFSAPGLDLRGIGGSIAGIPDIGFIAPIEFQAVNRLLKADPDESVMTSLYEPRKAAQIFTLGYATGARSGEITNREQRDLVSTTDRVSLLIRANKLGSVKTRYSTRAISLDGWIGQDALKEIFDDSSQFFQGSKPRSPLFSNSDENDLPINPDVISGLIGSTLKRVTGDVKARQYWLRHNAASLEFTYLFADAQLLLAIKHAQDNPVPFPINLSSAQFAQLIGGHENLSQIQAAAFRGRRGHASMMTSLTTYIHTIGLIEPASSRKAISALTSQGIASLTNKSNEWVRQTLHRAKVSISDHALSRNILVAALSFSKNEIAKDEVIEQPHQSLKFPISTGAIRRCAECYLRTGNAEEAVLRLHASKTIQNEVLTILLALKIYPRAIMSSPRNNVGGSNSIFTNNLKSEAKDILVGKRSIDGDAVNKLLRNMRTLNKKKTSDIDPLWNLILTGADPRNHIIRCKSKEEFLVLAKGMHSFLKESMPAHEVVAVISEKVNFEKAKNEIETIDGIHDIKIIKRALLLTSDDLPIGIGILSTGGQLRLTSLLLAAIVRKIWRHFASIA